jgi:hypothetical protein
MQYFLDVIENQNLICMIKHRNDISFTNLCSIYTPVFKQLNLGYKIGYLFPCVVFVFYEQALFTSFFVHFEMFVVQSEIGSSKRVG